MSFNALIIDDNQTNIDALALLVQLQGGTYFSARSPVQAVEALNHGEPINIVFLDLEFPNYSGLEWVAVLKNDERLHNCPFVAYTVHTNEENSAWEAGFDSFLGKPLNVERFPEYLDQILKGVQVWDMH